MTRFTNAYRFLAAIALIAGPIPAFGLGFTQLELEPFVDKMVRFDCETDRNLSYNTVKYRLELIQISKDYFMNYKETRSPVGLFRLRIYIGNEGKLDLDIEAEGQRRLTEFLAFEGLPTGRSFKLTFQGLPEGFGHMNYRDRSSGVNCVVSTVE